MNTLDNLSNIKKLDPKNMLGASAEFPEQIEQTWNEWKNIPLPPHFLNVKNVLLLGIGGSGIGAALVATLAEKMCNIPVANCRDYSLPTWVDRNTLIIAISHSGNTEETLTTFAEATTKTDKLITISTGGRLASLGSQHKALNYQYQSNVPQPRVATGYQIASLLAIFGKLKFIEINDDDINEAVILLKGMVKKLSAENATTYNLAKQLAQKLFGKIPVVVGSGTLSEVARRWKGDFNENAKQASYFEILPEMNHNALVGFEFPKNLTDKIFVIILQSQHDHARNKLRQLIVAQILQKRRIQYETVMMQPAGSVYAEMFQAITFGGFVSIYLAILNNTDPEPVEIIKFLKDKLSEVPF